MSLSIDLYNHLVHRCRDSLAKVRNKILKEFAQKLDWSEFHSAVLESVAEEFPEPNKVGGQPGNTNAKKNKVDIEEYRQENDGV